MSRRKLTAALAGVVASGAPLGPAAMAAAPRTHRHTTVETQNIAQVATTGKAGTPGYRLISAGAIRGKIGTRRITGALRTSGKITSAKTSTVHGTEYDAGGSRNFVLRIRFTIADGRVTDHGMGHRTGGSGTYRHASGTFKIAGSRPVGGASSIHLSGTIAY